MIGKMLFKWIICSGAIVLISILGKEIIDLIKYSIRDKDIGLLIAICVPICLAISIILIGFGV